MRLRLCAADGSPHLVRHVSSNGECMTNSLGLLTVSRKTGLERFHAGGQPLSFDLLSFWQWMASDLVSNATRGRVAEYLVARSLGLAEEDVRDEWAAFDLRTTSGFRVEVKSAAYLQSWHQSNLSRITFVVLNAGFARNPMVMKMASYFPK